MVIVDRCLSFVGGGLISQVCRVLSRVNAPNPVAIGNKNKGTNNRSENQNQNASNDNGDDSGYSYLKVFRSLMGLSLRDVQQLFDRANGDGSKLGAGMTAVKGELDRRKAAYMRVVRTVAPALGMMHGNPAMQGEVRIETRELVDAVFSDSDFYFEMFTPTTWVP